MTMNEERRMALFSPKSGERFAERREGERERERERERQRQRGGERSPQGREGS